MNSNTARLIAEDLSRASDLASDLGMGGFSEILAGSSEKMYKLERDLLRLEREKGAMVAVPLSLLKRLADDDWKSSVPDDYQPFLEGPDGSGAPATFTVGDLREAARIVQEAEDNEEEGRE